MEPVVSGMADIAAAEGTADVAGAVDAAGVIEGAAGTGAQLEGAGAPATPENGGLSPAEAAARADALQAADQLSAQLGRVASGEISLEEALRGLNTANPDVQTALEQSGLQTGTAQNGNEAPANPSTPTGPDNSATGQPRESAVEPDVVAEPDPEADAAEEQKKKDKEKLREEMEMKRKIQALQAKMSALDVKLDEEQLKDNPDAATIESLKAEMVATQQDLQRLQNEASKKFDMSLSNLAPYLAAAAALMTAIMLAKKMTVGDQSR